VPLERALSKLGVATRSEARALVTDGRVRINGRVTRDPLAAVTPERIRVEIDGQDAAPREFIAVALHKPRGVVTTRRDPQGRRTVYDLLADLGAHVIPVGRLDVATSGLILLTNDTRFADWLTDPANEVPRVYLVTVRGRVTDDEAKQLTEGVQECRIKEGGRPAGLSEECRSAGIRRPAVRRALQKNTPHSATPAIRFPSERLAARSATVRKSSGRESHLVVELVEGKNREVRRLISAIGHEVTRLRRVQLGGLTLDDLAPGAWRIVRADELARAFPGAMFSRKKLRGAVDDR
jgi:23S rRNA pseudouridine2605 synthase